jgi:hypothetical protein
MRLELLTLVCSLSLLLTERSEATLWFGLSDTQGHSIVVGLSSGPITSHPDRNSFFGHLDLDNGFVGVGATAIPSMQAKTIHNLNERARGPQDMIVGLERTFSTRRFIVAYDDGTILATQGATGCNSTNVYCGKAARERFAIVGGGLSSADVISAPLKFYDENLNRTEWRDLACKLIDVILSKGAEVQDFEYGVIWTFDGQALTSLFESKSESQLIGEVKTEICGQ